jgi:PAS domain S-box-containing protein
MTSVQQPPRVVLVGQDACVQRLQADLRKDSSRHLLVESLAERRKGFTPASVDEASTPFVVVIGPDEAQPLQTARHFRERGSCQIVFLLEREQLDQFRAGLPFVPQFGDAWTVTSDAAPEAMTQVVLDAVEKGRRQAAAASVSAWINRQLGPPRTTSSEVELRGINETLAAQFTRALTDRERAEARWRSLFDTSTLGISLLDHDLRFLDANAAFKAMLGYSDEELRKLSPLDISAAEDREATRALLTELQTGKRRNYEMVKQYRRKDGALIWAQTYVSMAPGTESEPRVILGTTIDITAQKHAEDALREARSELARVARMSAMGEITASIAHEIGQPLTAIVANGNAAMRLLAKKSPDLDEARMALNRIIADGHRAAQVIASIRTMFKRGDPKRVRLDVNGLIQEILALMRGELQSKRIALRIAFAEKLPQLLGERAQLQQVILNLIINAIEAMVSVTDRARTLRVTTEAHYPAVLITVEDSGTGIDPANIGRIFDTFFTTKEQGMGMGLSISRSIIEAHGGRLSAAPGEPYGSIFQIVLPADAPAGES